MKKIRRTGAAVLLAIYMLGGCGQQEHPQTEGPVDRNEVVVVLPTDSEPASGFDPVSGWGAGDHVHEPLIQSTLTRTLPDLQIGYDLATDCSVSGDGMLWTVTLRPGVLFTDGKPLTAGDVAFTYNTIKENGAVSDFTMLERAEAVDDRTVCFYMEHPFSSWPYVMSNVGIIPAHCYDSGNYGQCPTGSGRYVLQQWDPGQQLILKANPTYYGEAPKLKKVTVLFMEEDAAYLAAKTGQADVVYTSPVYAEQEPTGFHLKACRSVDNRGINLPAAEPADRPSDGATVGNAVTADPVVRKAIHMAVDRESLITHVLDGYAVPAYSVCDGMPWHQEAAAEMSCDPDGAAELLERGGWRLGTDGVRVREDGLRAAFPILYPGNESTRQAIAVELANQLKNIGISAEPAGVGWDTAYTRALSAPMVWGWGTHTPMELYHIYHTMPETGLAKYSPYANATVDWYMDQALACSDPEEAIAFWKQAQWDGTTGVTGAGDGPWIWLLNVEHLYWVRNGLEIAPQKIHPHGHGWSVMDYVDQWEWE